MAGVETIEVERRQIISKLPDRDLQFLPVADRLEHLRSLARYGYHILASYQEPNGLLQATLGRVDNEDFVDAVWVKDHVRAGRSGLDPQVGEYLPELKEGLTNLYVSSTRGLLRVLSQPEQMARFKEVRPSGRDEKGYASLADEEAPPIKFHTDGRPWEGWSKSNNQPDNWGTLLLEVGRGIEQGLPILAPIAGEQAPAGMVIQRITSYVVGLQVERLICRSIWEHTPVYSSYSNRSIVAAGSGEIEKVWGKILSDSRERDYPLEVSRTEIKKATNQLRKLRKEHYPADYTDIYHPQASDLAPMIVLNDTELPDKEREDIMQRVSSLRNGVGYSRFIGDPYRRGWTEAKWTLGLPVAARFYFKEATRCYSLNKTDEGNRAVDRGLEYMDTISRLIRTFGYIPELFYDKNRDGRFVENNNELGWFLSYLTEASAAGIAALSKSEQYRSGRVA